MLRFTIIIIITCMKISVMQLYCKGTDVGCDMMKLDSFILGGNGGIWSSLIISIIFGGIGGASFSFNLGGNGGGSIDSEISPCGTSSVLTSIGSLPA